MHHYTFFKEFFNKPISRNRLEVAKFLNLRHKKENSGSQNKKLKVGEYFYSSDKRKTRGVIMVDKLP